MATLNWIGKQAVAGHHRKVPYRLLKCDKKLSAGDPDAGNLLVQGDNLEALKALLPYYGGQVKCIYIDPPYNTGNEGWVYIMYPRLTLLRECLRSAGIIFVSTDTRDEHLTQSYHRTGCEMNGMCL